MRVREWDHVLFTDECKVMVDSNDKRQHVNRSRGECFRDCCLREVDRWGRGSTMIWGGISFHGKTDLVFLDQGVGRGGRRGRRGAGRGLTARRYIDEVIDPVVLPFVQQHAGMILQHDNARIHIARATQQHLRNNNINVLDQWPALSADLNPKEHLWDYLKSKIRYMHLDNVGELRDALSREWRQIPLRLIQRLVRSMKRRCRAVIVANGGHTRY